MPNRIIRRPDSTLIVFGEAPAQAYKLSQPDVGRAEQQYGRPSTSLARTSWRVRSTGCASLSYRSTRQTGRLWVRRR
ncbi:MAG: hypothetical protein HZY76_15340 [Anaerolineae bacterium]|nr:MAG: hypothetical protein HZY76_15340 [Anaerolineae bacterium]